MYTEELKKGPQGVPGRRGGSGERGVCTELRVWGREEASRGLVSDRSVITAAPRSPVVGTLMPNTATAADSTEPGPAMRQTILVRGSPEFAWRVSGWGWVGLGGWPTQARHRNGVERFLKI